MVVIDELGAVCFACAYDPVNCTGLARPNCSKILIGWLLPALKLLWKDCALMNTPVYGRDLYCLS